MAIREYIKSGTSTNADEKVSFGFTARQITVINDATGSDTTDTMYISETSAFTATSTYTRKAGEFFTKPLVWESLYFKFGSTATAGKAYRIEVE